MRCLGWAAVLTCLPALVAQAPSVQESAHYRIVAHPPFQDGEEYLKLAEALYPQLARHFGAEPPAGTRLEVAIWPDAASYRRGGAADGIPDSVLSAGGVYWTGTKRAYFWRQPSASFTRHLFLHELTHQFHFLAVMDNQARAPGWYTEGIAEYFARHRWDGAKLTCGVSDVVGLEEDVPRMAQEAREGRYDLLRVLRGDAGAAKPTSWAALHYLLAGPDEALRARFRALEKRIWAGTLQGPALVAELFGKDTNAAREAANRWLGALETTWKIEWIHWDTRGDDLVAESQVVALARSRAEFAKGSHIAATLRTESGSAGLVLAFRSTADFLAVYRRPSGRIELVRRRAGAWEKLASTEGGSAGTDAVRLAAGVAEDGTCRIRVEGREVLRLDLGPDAARGSVGLFADAGRTRFSGVAIGRH